MPGTTLICFDGHPAMGQFLGDSLCCLKVAWLFVQNEHPDRILLTLQPHNPLNFIWQRFIQFYSVQVIYNEFEPGNMEHRIHAWNRWRRDRSINGTRFDTYRELYRRIDGAHRQTIIAGSEKGLGRRNIFEYMYYGQEGNPPPCVGGDHFGNDLIFYKPREPDRGVLIAPHAKCQGNRTFTFGYWDNVVRKCLDMGVPVTVNYNGHFCEDLEGHPLFRKVYPPFQELREEILSHRLVACGNTGIGWLAAACGVPLLAMQPIDSHIQDYRYEWCGVKSLVEYLSEPDASYCAQRIRDEVDSMLVMTTGCFDVIHAGHIRHLEESRSLGSKLIVALNSDDSIRQLKGSDRPFHKQDERKSVLEAMKWVDEVRIFDGPDAMPLIQELRPAIITNGPDHKPDAVVGREFVESYGGKVVITGGDRTVSTTKTLRTMRQVELIALLKDAEKVSVNPFHKLKRMADEYASVAHLDGCCADLGTYKGGCAMVLRRVHPEKPLYLFDTWTGNPHNDPLCHHKAGDWKCEMKEAQNRVGMGAFTHYCQGVFPVSATDLNGLKWCFVNVDCDTYQTAKAAIHYFWPRMVEGGKMYFDDIPWIPCAGAEKAVNEFFGKELQARYGDAHACVVTKPKDVQISRAGNLAEDSVQLPNQEVQITEK